MESQFLADYNHLRKVGDIFISKYRSSMIVDDLISEAFIITHPHYDQKQFTGAMLRALFNAKNEAVPLVAFDEAFGKTTVPKSIGEQPCYGCNQGKDVNEFSLKWYICDDCQRNRQRGYKLKNHQKKPAAVYYQENKDKIKAATKAYYQRNKAEYNEQKRLKRQYARINLEDSYIKHLIVNKQRKLFPSYSAKSITVEMITAERNRLLKKREVSYKADSIE